jgi:hypothetical protein
MNPLLKKIELIANLCIIVVALVIGAVVVRRFLLHAPAGEANATTIPAGAKLVVPGLDWSGNGRTLLLVLSAGCKYCTTSAPFYQRLASASVAHQSTKLVAVLPQSVEQSRAYLKSLGVQIAEVKQLSPATLGASGTPTLILADSSGVVISSWVGQLPSEKEAEVLANLQ